MFLHVISKRRRKSPLINQQFIFRMLLDIEDDRGAARDDFQVLSLCIFQSKMNEGESDTLIPVFGRNVRMHQSHCTFIKDIVKDGELSIYRRFETAPLFVMGDRYFHA